MSGDDAPRHGPMPGAAGRVRQAVLAIASALAMAPALALMASAPSARAQPVLRAYAFTLAGPVTDASGGSRSAASFTRARLMGAASAGPLALDAAYEQTLLAVSETGTGLTALLPGAPRGVGDWLPLDGVLWTDPHAAWRNRVDRLSIAAPLGPARVTAGRQAISWATTLFLTPADPFAPFDPADPFREYRTGVDAARARFDPGAFSQVDLVVRPADTRAGKTITALARGLTKRGVWDLSAWAGALHDDPAAAIAAAGTVGGSAIRAEGELRRVPDATPVWRSALGLDRRVSALERDLTLVLEWQHDGFGAARAADLPAVAQSPPALRGELQVYGRDELAVQASWQVHPLAAIELVTLLNLRDGSALWAPGLTFSATEWLSLRLGGDLGSGAGTTGGAPVSEYGASPRFAWASLSVFL